MGEPHEPLAGFSWRSGTKRDTTGIIMWSDVFLHTIDRTGERIAIFVMDTQGLFDNDSTPTDNSRIFGIGTVISSIQVLNLLNRVQEDQLQYLQFAAEFTKFTALQEDELNGKPFQNLTFLIRDWNNDEEYEFGIEGGNRYFEEQVLKITPTQEPELRSVRESIKSSFENIGCCLLPHPGMAVVRRKNYDGKWSEMEEDFVNELKKVIEYLLLPENMVLKKINSQELTGKEIRTYIDQYFELFKSNDIPPTMTIYEMTIESHMNNLVKKCIDDYYLTIFCNRYLFKYTKRSITMVHEKCKAKALQLFDNEKKMGTIEHENKFRAKLDDEIQQIFIKHHESMINQFVGNEELKEKLNVSLSNELKLKREVENALEQANSKLEELEEKLWSEQISLDGYERQKKILQERIEAERQRLDNIQGSRENSKSFARNLATNVGIAFGITCLATGAGFLVLKYGR